jgi:SAM-dependent methyltransferase
LVKVREFFKTDAGSGGVHGGTAKKQGNTEDAFFFSMLEDAGLKSYVDTNMLCGHYDSAHNIMYYPPFDGDQAKEPAAWMQEKRIINLGAGASAKPNELNVDLQKAPNVDFVCDIRKLPDEWSNSFDVAKASHVLEHFDFGETGDVLVEWLRILKPGGKLEITVPDLQAVAEEMVKDRFDVLMQGNIYGDEGHPFWNQEPYGGYDPDKVRFLKHSKDNNHHKSGYTAKSLIDLLRAVGFVNVKAERHLPIWEIHVVGEKPVEVAPVEEQKGTDG